MGAVGLLDSITGAGLAVLRLEFVQVLRMRKGPFQAHANRSILRGAAIEMDKTLDESNIIFQTLYEEIVANIPYLASLPGVGTSDHIKKSWKWCMQKLKDKTAGSNVKTSRWWSWESRSDEATWLHDKTHPEKVD